MQYCMDAETPDLKIYYFNPFTPKDRFSSFQSNEWKSPLKLLSVERVNIVQYSAGYRHFQKEGRKFFNFNI